MFKVGKFYYIQMWEPGDGGHLMSFGHCEVTEVALPLIKYRHGAEPEKILNTTSPAFISATEINESPPEPITFKMPLGFILPNKDPAS